MDTPAPELSWWLLSSGMIGGLAIFLLGMAQMTDALRTAAGGYLQTVLAWTTANRVVGLGVGAGVTAVIQSSSVTTVLLVGFVSAGLMSFPQTIGVILGANIGCTVTAQIIALKVIDSALLLVAAGYLASIGFHRHRFRSGGRALLGLGLIFLGMNLMGEATRPLRDFPAFVDGLAGLTHPFAGFLLGTLFTAVIQSSAATVGLVIILASQNLIGLETGTAIVLGANVGTCATALLSSLRKPRTARQVAVAHLCFNLLGALLWLFFIGPFAELTRRISPEDLARQIANAHTLFNVGNAALFIAFTRPFAAFVERLVPVHPAAVSARQTKLDPYYLQNPETALELSRQELLTLGHQASAMVADGFPVFIQGDRPALEELRARDRPIDDAHREILEFLGQLAQQRLTPAEQSVVQKQLLLANAFENIADLVATHLVEAAEHRVRSNLEVSAATREQLRSLYTEAAEAVQSALEANEAREPSRGRKVLEDKAHFKEREEAFRQHLADRLSAQAPDRVALFRFESEVLEATHNLHRLARTVARNAGSTGPKKPVETDEAEL